MEFHLQSDDTNNVAMEAIFLLIWYWLTSHIFLMCQTINESDTKGD